MPSLVDDDERKPTATETPTGPLDPKRRVLPTDAEERCGIRLLNRWPEPK